MAIGTRRTIVANSKIRNPKSQIRNVLIVADIEGSSGCWNYAASAFLTDEWCQACLQMSRDVNRVVSALFDAGVETIMIKDFHRTGFNLLPELIDPRSEINHGYRAGPVPGIVLGIGLGLLALAADQPESWSLLGEVGIEAAWLGDRETATEISQRLLAVDEPFTLGGPSYVRAAIATRLGDHAEGIRLLHQAAAEGFWDWERLHRDMDFEPLRDDPEFQEIVRPKG